MSDFSVAPSRELPPMIELILPERDMDTLADQLVALTEAIDAVDPDRVAHGFLGGQHGYGGHWNSETFQMRPYCWCEGDDCLWCMGCDCPETALHHMVDGQEVSSAEWSAFFEREVGPSESAHSQAAHEAWMKRAAAANARREIAHHKTCAYCTSGRFPEFGAVPGKCAPNFWHKPSGLRVWWYKYIGRSQEVFGPATPDIFGIFAQCLRDVQAQPSQTGELDGATLQNPPTPDLQHRDKP